jgi:DNA replication protein DnaC
MANAFESQLVQPLPDLDFEERLGLLIDAECILRENRQLQRRLTQAKLQQRACLEDIDYDAPRGLVKTKLLELSRGQWLHNRFNLLITGPTGCGKTYLACALAHRACLDGFTSRYYRLPRLWEELKVAKATGTYAQCLNQLAKVDLLLLDDWGLVAPELERCQDLLEILDDRYQKRSTLVTSQLSITHWHTHLNDPTLADAILDRLLHNAVRLELKGESMRKSKKSCQQEEVKG